MHLSAELTPSLATYSAEVSAVQTNAQVSVDNGDISHPAMGSTPEVQAIVTQFLVHPSVGSHRELNTHGLNAHLSSGQA